MTLKWLTTQSVNITDCNKKGGIIMINKPNDWDNVKAASTAEREKLPAGGYEAKIIGAKVVPNSNGTQRLEIAVDVAAGLFRD